MTEHEYKKMLKPYSRALQQLLLELEFFLEDIGPINIYSISSRLKSFPKALRKSRQFKIEIQDLQDLAGIRVVVATQKEVDVITRFFTRQKYVNDLKVESDKKIARENGYRARHIVVNLKGNYKRSMYASRIEIQLQTIFEHAYNFISRAWVYKNEKCFSEDWKSNFLELSKMLAIIDEKIVKLHDEVIKSSAKDGDDEPLSPLSYQRIVHSIFNEEVKLDDAVDSCRFYADLGYNTNGKLKNFLNNPEIHRLRDHLSTLNDPYGVKIARFFLDLPFNQFWGLAGTRISAMYELIDKFKKSKNNIDS